MKICILLPRFNKNPFVYDDKDNDKNYNYMFPLGLSYISASLKQNNYDVNFINLNHYKGLIKDIIDCEFKKNKYDFVFTGSLSFYYPNIKDYVKYIREISPTTKIVLGGGIISSQPTIMFNLIKPDYIVIGEGEQTVVELLKCIQTNGDLTQINGIGYINNNILIFTKPREPILNLDSLPFPDYESCGLDEYLNHLLPTNYIGFDTFDTPRIYPLLMSRSCPFECTFCYHQLGQKYRQRSIDNILDEIQFAVIKYKINIFTFYDELFSHDRSRIIDFCTKFNELRKTLPWVIKWNCALRVDNIDDELVKIMKNSGCFMISFGLESYSNVILKSMKKHITPEQINNAIHIVSNNNIAIQGTFIFGDPAETLETAQNTLNYFKHNQNILKGGVQLGFIMLFQGSPLYKYCLSNGTITNEINFIENRASNGYIFHKPQNLTNSLSDKKFKKLKNNIMTTIYTTGYYTLPIFLTKGELHIKCPYCNNISILKNVIAPTGINSQNVGCRYCNGRFYIVSKHYYIYIHLLKIIGFYNTIKLLSIISKIKNKLNFKFFS